jgi:hypothetical protein
MWTDRDDLICRTLTTEENVFLFVSTLPAASRPCSTPGLDLQRPSLSYPTGPQPDRLLPCRPGRLCALLHALPSQGVYAVVRCVLLVGRCRWDGRQGVESDEQVWGRPRHGHR